MILSERKTSWNTDGREIAELINIRASYLAVGCVVSVLVLISEGLIEMFRAFCQERFSFVTATGQVLEFRTSPVYDTVSAYLRGRWYVGIERRRSDYQQGKIEENGRKVYCDSVLPITNLTQSHLGLNSKLHWAVTKPDFRHGGKTGCEKDCQLRHVCLSVDASRPHSTERLPPGDILRSLRKFGGVFRIWLKSGTNDPHNTRASICGRCWAHN
jgi:hypothetical protein